MHAKRYHRLKYLPKITHQIQIFWGKYGSQTAWLIFILALVWINWSNIKNFGVEDDINIYYYYVQYYIVGHEIPYSNNFAPAYPPGAFLIFLLPRLFVNFLSAYKIAFAFFTDLALAIGAFFIFRKGKSLSLILFSVFLLLCQPDIILQRFDAIVSIILFISLLQFTKKEYTLSMALLAISVFIKFFPVILLPFYLLWLPNNSVRLKQLAVFISIIALALLPFFLNGATFYGLMHFFDFNKDRGIQLESSWASILILLKPLQQNFQIQNRYGSMEIISSLTPMFSNLAFYFSLTYLLGISVLGWKIKKKMLTMDKKGKELPFWEISFLALAGFMFFNKVFSDQYVLWLVPLAPILIYYYKFWPKILMIIFFSIFLYATSKIWPQNWGALIEGREYAVNVLLFRNITLFAIFFYIFLKNVKLSCLQVT